MYRILTINPGSTSTKIGVFEDENPIFVKNIHHETEEVSQFEHITDQEEFRREIIIKTLEEAQIDLSAMDAVVGRGGLVKPIVSGTYEVTPELIRDLKQGVSGQHASNLGGILAKDLAAECGNVPSFIVDPVVVDEMEDLARISGHPKLPRISIFHALNAKAIAKRYAKEVGKNYEELNLIVAHLGGGVSVGAHKAGKVIDVFNGLDGDGAFAPERSGALPSGALIRLCFSGEVTEKEAYRMVVGAGGVVAYLGTNNMMEVENRAKAGDEQAALIREAFAYQISKNIGSMACVLSGKVDQILITGGVAYDKGMVEMIKERTSFICPVSVYPGEDELLALAQGALRVLNKEEEAKQYK